MILSEGLSLSKRRYWGCVLIGVKIGELKDLNHDGGAGHEIGAFELVASAVYAPRTW